MKFFSDAVLAWSQRLYSLTALCVHWSPSVLSLVWEAAAAPRRDPASDCIHTPQFGFAFGGIHRCCKVWSLIAPCWTCWCPHPVPSTHSSSSPGNDRPGQPGRSRAWAGPVLLDSLPTYPTQEALRSAGLWLPPLALTWCLQTLL